ncbi:flagellar M-ring protein FliF [Halobacillus shinanisalinarum]|uniref:Flagellar M-ring protein n=1 Tax=Halobacillus shinanisalinarum TaxID=2932258 RepID=A0ABY4H2L8_9BACI|nr:flagellar basal-body MS-ring/collar protein FliF [Halobacillus shinanisalinarum]UOQ93217.1 flagellar M-ring protein FliF [Halobacillus shinanisalinarum]
MKEKLILFKNRVTVFWSERSSKQKRLLIGSIAGLILLVGIASIFATRTNMVPLYRDLSLQEVGQVKAELDTRAVPYELDQGGTTISVPEAQAESLLVDLAAAGLPNSGSIDYSFFSGNVSWGMTDNEFDVIKLDAMQTELANLMTGITGIEDAKVMINIPEEQVFMSETNQEASASVVLSIQPGYDIQANQVEALYNLASKSVPNLSKDNIVIMDQNFNYFDTNQSNVANGADAYTYQQNIKQDIERDIQQRVQKMLGLMIGQDKVVATVTADIDFTKENRVEELVESVDPENMEGLPVSVERIEETYTGGAPEGGVPAGEGDIPAYQGEAAGEGDNGDYEMTKETINNEFNRIRRNIEESPYKVRDLGIQVAIDNTKGTNPEGEVQQLTQQEQQTVEDSVQSILNSMITTSINEGYGEVDPEEKISIVFQEFSGEPNFPEEPTGIPMWMYVAGGVLLVVIAVLLWLLFRRRNQDEEEEEVFEEIPVQQPITTVADIEEKETDSSVRRKQLERMAKEKPEDFAKLLRSWIAED